MEPKVALVTDWITSYGGEHRVLWAMHELFPNAPIYTTIYNKEALPMYQEANVITSYLDRFPFANLARKKHQIFLPGMPLAFEAFDLSEYDIVISSSHACSKGIITKVKTLHYCYCHSPMRYAWDDCHRYIEENTPFAQFGGKYISEKIMHHMRMWDRLAADRVDVFAANSSFIQKRIKKYYQRESKVIYPPIATGNFSVGSKEKTYFLAGGRLVPNKRYDLAIEACNRLGLPLKIYGKGPALPALQAIAKENVEFLGFVTDEEVAELMSNAKAFIVPQLEDFGIVTVEAQSAGTPIIGLNDGGTKELVIDGVTGVLFDEQTPESVTAAIQRFSGMTFDSNHIRQQALSFDTARFKRELYEHIMIAYKEHCLLYS